MFLEAQIKQYACKKRKKQTIGKMIMLCKRGTFWKEVPL